MAKTSNLELENATLRIELEILLKKHTEVETGLVMDLDEMRDNLRKKVK